MQLKNTYLLLAMLLTVTFLAGCAQLMTAQTENSDETNLIISHMLDRLSTTIPTYEASYKKEFNDQSWAGHSASYGHQENSTIEIELQNNEIIKYSINQTVEEFPDFPLELQGKNHYQFYDITNKELCTKTLISRTQCEFEKSIPPEFGGTLTGCKATIVPDGRGSCLCDGEPILIDSVLGFACSEEVNTENMELFQNYGHSIYYPENSSGFCYYYTKDMNTEEHWAFECKNKPVLKPKNITLTNLKGIKCTSPGRTCSCEINPPQYSLSCSQETPKNFDTETKKEITYYLTTINITSISEENHNGSYCYSFFNQNLDNKICFDEKNLLTYAQWGWNLQEEKSTHININTIEKVQ